MSHYLNDWMSESSQNERLVCEEDLILDVNEKIWELLEKQGVSRSELAERLGVSRAYVTQLMNGNKNMTLRTLASIGFVLGFKASINFFGTDSDDNKDNSWSKGEVVNFSNYQRMRRCRPTEIVRSEQWMNGCRVVNE